MTSSVYKCVYIYTLEVQIAKDYFWQHPSKGSSFSDHLKTVLNMVLDSQGIYNLDLFVLTCNIL